MLWSKGNRATDKTGSQERLLWASGTREMTWTQMVERSEWMKKGESRNTNTAAVSLLPHYPPILHWWEILRKKGNEQRGHL